MFLLLLLQVKTYQPFWCSIYCLSYTHNLLFARECSTLLDFCFAKDDDEDVHIVCDVCSLLVTGCCWRIAAVYFSFAVLLSIQIDASNKPASFCSSTQSVSRRSPTKAPNQWHQIKIFGDIKSKFSRRRWQTKVALPFIWWQHHTSTPYFFTFHTSSYRLYMGTLRSTEFWWTEDGGDQGMRESLREEKIMAMKVWQTKARKFQSVK